MIVHRRASADLICLAPIVVTVFYLLMSWLLRRLGFVNGRLRVGIFSAGLSGSNHRPVGECLTLTRQIQDDASPGHDICPGQADVDRRQVKYGAC